MGVVNPASFPVYLWLHCCEPWVSEDGFMFAEIREKELEGNGSGPGSDIQNGVVAEVSTSVFGPIDVEQFLGFRELLDGEL